MIIALLAIAAWLAISVVAGLFFARAFSFDREAASPETTEGKSPQLRLVFSSDRGRERAA